MTTETATPVRDLLADLNAASLDATSLDARTFMLIRIAALVAVDAPPVSYLLNLAAASDVEITETDVEQILIAVAPIVGTARVASAATKIARAVGIAISVAEADAEAQAQEDAYRDSDN